MKINKPIINFKLRFFHYKMSELTMAVHDRENIARFIKNVLALHSLNKERCKHLAKVRLRDPYQRYIRN